MSQRLEQTYLRNWILLPLLLFLLFYAVDFVFLAVAQSSDVHILNFVFKTEEFSETAAAAYNYGFNASLSSRGFKLAGQKVNIIPMAPALDKVASSIDRAVGNSKDLFLVLGPASAQHTRAALDALRKNDVIALNPLTQLSTAHRWENHLYFFFISTPLSVYTFIRHAVINLRVRRLGFMHTTGVEFGDGEYNYAKEKMRAMNRELCGDFRIDGRVSYTGDNKEFNERWEAFAETLPQAVIMITFPKSAAKLFVEKMLKDPRTSSAYLMVPFLLKRMTVNLWEAARVDGAPVFPGQVITASTYPSPEDTSFAVVRKYRAVVDKYFAKEVQNGNVQTQANHDKWIKIGATLAGWVTGEILFQALSRFNPALSRADFISSMFNQRSYSVEEIIIGTFAGELSETLKKAGAVSRCNEGAVTAYVKKYMGGKRMDTVGEGNYRNSLHICQVKNLALYDSASIVTVNFTDVPAKYYMINEMKVGQEAGFRYRHSVPKHDLTLKVLQATNDAVTSIVREEKENKWMNIVTGVMHEETLDIPNVTFIDPILTLARMNTFRKNVVFLSPTVEQQLFVLAEYIARLPDRSLHAVIRGASGNAVLDKLKKSLLTFGVALTSSVLLGEFDKIEDKLPSSGITLLFGTYAVDVPTFIAHLERNTNARLIILCIPFAIVYEQLCAAFKGKDVAERFLVITNLPHWADANSLSKVVRKYHEKFTNSSVWSPLSLQNFIVGIFIRRVVEELEVVNASSVIEYFYTAIVVHLDDMAFGPFADSNSVTCTSASKLNSLDCAKNFGATSISVWPMSRVFDPNVRPLFGPVTPSLKYLVPSTGLTRSQEIGVIVGSLLGAAVLAAVLWLLIYFFCTGNANAPKNPEAPVTLIFTDIQSSTALWAACPDIMPDAVETHHRLIRRLISKYRCYEVKTVGDSFMIACKSPYAAVKLVDDLQRTFLEYDWGTSAIDKAYHEFEEHQAEEDADYKPPTARLDDAVYRKLWSGLRVRAGVHSGLSDIQRDEVTKRYDYYGSTSNTAARTESVANGGQVLLTRAAYMALSTAERAGLNVTPLSAVELRGVPEPVEMFQLNPVPDRAFADLRLERGNDDFEFDTSTFNGTETSGSVSESLSPAAENLFAVLHDIYAPFPPHQRLKVLELLCKRWKVTVPVVANTKDVLAVSRLTEQRLAMKISRVIERRQLTHDRTTYASEILSSRSGNFLIQNSSKPSSSRDVVFSRRVGSKCSHGSERYVRNSVLSFNVHRGSLVLSGTSSIQVRKPSFIDFY